MALPSASLIAPAPAGLRGALGGALLLFCASRLLVIGAAVLTQLAEPGHGLMRSGRG